MIKDASLSQLRNSYFDLERIYLNDTGLVGFFKQDPTDNSTVDDGVDTIVNLPTGFRYKREQSYVTPAGAASSVLYVSKSAGDNNTATKGIINLPYADPWAAVADAASGDHIEVVDGVWEVSPYSGSADFLLEDLAPDADTNLEANLWKDGISWRWANSAGIRVLNYDPTPNVEGHIFLFYTASAQSMNWEGGFIEHQNLYWDSGFMSIQHAGASFIFNPHKIICGTATQDVSSTLGRQLTMTVDVYQGQIIDVIQEGNVVIREWIPQGFDYTTLAATYTTASAIARDVSFLYIGKVIKTAAAVSVLSYEIASIIIDVLSSDTVSLNIHSSASMAKVRVNHLYSTDVTVGGTTSGSGIISLDGYSENHITIGNTGSPNYRLSGNIYTDDTNAVYCANAISVMFAGFSANVGVHANITPLGLYTDYTT